MSKLLSLLLVILFSFNVALAAARPKTLKHHSAPALTSVTDGKHLTTNARRFAAGFPPLPPLVKKRPTTVDTAKRAVTSQCAKSGVIQVLNADTNAVLGYVSQNLPSNRRGLAADLNDAGTFSSTVFVTGQTASINIRDATDATHFLAGMVLENEPLGDGSSDNTAAILGWSLATNPGDTPQANRDATFPNRDAETAIWTYNRADNSLTAIWVNYAGQTPATTTAYISYVPGNRFFLTNTRTAPQNGDPVLFQFISVNDQCDG